MRLSDLILRGRALLRGWQGAEEEPVMTMPQRVFKGSKLVRIPNKIRKRFGAARR